MKDKDFLELLRMEEKENIDFKLKCNAFHSKGIKDNAELVKDVCAMSNNRKRKSYIIIGVSDDKIEFQTVKNSKLTEENLQDLCKNAIYPIPKLSLSRKRFSNNSLSFKDIIFVIITIGPHRKKSVYRINRDFIDYGVKICIRKNDVWIRQGSISRLASPEEIIDLFKKNPTKLFPKPENNSNYMRLKNIDSLEKMQSDFKNFTRQQGGRLFSRQKNKPISLFNQDRAVLKINSDNILLHYFFIKEAVNKFSILGSIFREWCYEPTVLIFSNGAVTKNSFHKQFNPHFKEDWGWVSYAENSNLFLPKLYFQIPSNVERYGIFIITLPNIKDTDKMFYSMYNMLDFLKDNFDIYKEIRINQEKMRKNIEIILKDGWITETNKLIIGEILSSNLKKHEIYDQKRFGNKIMRVDKSKALIKGFQRILDLMK